MGCGASQAEFGVRLLGDWLAGSCRVPPYRAGDGALPGTGDVTPRGLYLVCSPLRCLPVTFHCSVLALGCAVTSLDAPSNAEVSGREMEGKAGEVVGRS